MSVNYADFIVVGIYIASLKVSGTFTTNVSGVYAFGLPVSDNTYIPFTSSKFIFSSSAFSNLNSMSLLGVEHLPDYEDDDEDAFSLQISSITSKVALGFLLEGDVSTGNGRVGDSVGLCWPVEFN